jgi:hypothetical protein
MNWNENTEKFVARIGELCAGYRWMHRESVRLYSALGTTVNLGILLCSTVLTTESVFGSSEKTGARTAGLFATSVLSVIQNFFKYGNLVQYHSQSESQFLELYQRVQTQLVLCRPDRVDSSEFTAKLVADFDSLVTSGPTLGWFVLYRFNSTFKNSGIAMPDSIPPIVYGDPEDSIEMNPMDHTDRIDANPNRSVGMPLPEPVLSRNTLTYMSSLVLGVGANGSVPNSGSRV